MPSGALVCSLFMYAASVQSLIFMFLVVGIRITM